jgi:hypothetical protein
MPVLEPVLSYRVFLPADVPAHTALQKLRQLEEEDPQLHLTWNEDTREIGVQLMGTVQLEVLRNLAARLGTTMSFFLEEDVVVSANQTIMENARKCFAQQDHTGVLSTLEAYRTPDSIFDEERWLLEAMSALTLARQAMETGKRPYAVQLLQRCAQAGDQTVYYGAELERERCLLLARLEPALVEKLPSMDEELCLRAKLAMEKGGAVRSARILEAAEERSAVWHMLRGKTAFAMGQYREAADYLHQAETEFPQETAVLLESCYRELEDFKQAYFYACKQKEAPK